MLSFQLSPLQLLSLKKYSVSGNSGTVIDDNLTVACKSHSIHILELQKQGKNKQTAKEFLLGNKIISGTNIN